MAAPGQRPDIEKKIVLISDRIVRAYQAKNNRSILLFRIRTAAAVIGSTLMTVGLENPLLSLASGKGDQTLNYTFGASWYGLPKIFSFFGVGIFVLVAIALAFYKQAKIDERAIQSIALVDAFEGVESRLVLSLEDEEPIQQLNVVYNEAVALDSNNSKNMPKRDGFKSAIDSYAQTKINDYCKWWKDAPPPDERREK